MKRGQGRTARLAWLVLAGALSVSRGAAAQAEPTPVQRDVDLSWDNDRGLLYLDMVFRDVLDAGIRGKLSRGLPTTVVLTATVQRAGSAEPLSTTTQTCRITWHVWEEAYYLEIVRPGATQARWTTTLEGVLRRCAEVHRLLAGDAAQVQPTVPIYARGSIQINPVSPEVLDKLQRWVMRPSSTGTAAPGDALFSTFTGLFLQRIGDAEREVRFFTKPKLVTRFSSKQEEKRQ
ncbi:MAG TPA: hypothetical protein VGQ57_14780 [Polyangiaceae bacterium]|nr:hypothetical protein [Polyangiaceae bacterium]